MTTVEDKCVASIRYLLSIGLRPEHFANSTEWGIHNEYDNVGGDHGVSALLLQHGMDVDSPILCFLSVTAKQPVP